MKNILFVDDNPDMLDMVKRGFEKYSESIRVIGASNGDECLSFLEKSSTPDLILLDIMMPGINGWDLFAKIREKPKLKDTPIVFLTAKNDNFSRGFGKLNATDYIEKPFEMKELIQRAEEIMGS
jgi:two-component system response regulator VicR